MSGVTSLFDLAANEFVKHVYFLSQYTEVIPITLYNDLLLTSLKMDRILSTKHLLLSWPLEKLSLVDCEQFTEQCAIMLAYCLESGCNKLCEITISGCNIGALGTTALLKLLARKRLPSITEYCADNDRKISADDKSTAISNIRLSITTDCFVDSDNYRIFLKALLKSSSGHNFKVSRFYAIGLHHGQIIRILVNLAVLQAESVNGLDLRMTGFCLHEPHQLRIQTIPKIKSLQNFSNLQYLDLSMNRIDSMNSLLFFLENITVCLTHLLLNNCLNHSPLFHKMSSLLCVQKLQHFEYGGNRLQGMGSEIMIFLQNCSGTLTYLNLKENLLRDDSIPSLMQLLEAPFHLKTLHIHENSFSIDAERQLLAKDELRIIDGYRFMSPEAYQFDESRIFPW